MIGYNIEAIAKSIFPKGKTAQFAPFWNECFEYAEINTKDRIAMFFAQVGHECQYFTRFVENLNYSAQGLANTWPYRYSVRPKDKKKTPNKLALSLHYKPVAIACNVYAKRLGNGTELSGEGWTYRGRSPMMCTGKKNYQEFTNEVGVKHGVDFVANPDLLLEPRWGLMFAVWYWKENNLNSLADRRLVEAATKVINGGAIGLDERKRLYSTIQDGREFDIIKIIKERENLLTSLITCVECNQLAA